MPSKYNLPSNARLSQGSGSLGSGSAGGAQETSQYRSMSSSSGKLKGPRLLQRTDTQDMPQFGATFVPGGYDDYQMPEMYAPSPQRVMPEVPQNMQSGLQHMENAAHDNYSQRNNGPTPNYLGNLSHTRDESYSSQILGFGDGGQGEDFQAFEDSQTSYQTMSATELPNFSPFPPVKGDNIPPNDEEKEEILYNAREHVLHSNNVSMQLSWARDALSWVETAGEVWQRENRHTPNKVRTNTPKIEAELRVDAINIIKYLSEQRHPEAVFMKAKWDEFGKFGFPEDKPGAFKTYIIAAGQGWGRAEYRMGMMCENSNSMAKAIQHYQNGERMGDSAAMYRLGMMALLGQHGQRKDIQRGLDLVNRAADTADEDAPQGAYVFGMLIARDLPDIELPENVLPYQLDTARQYIEKAAYLGFAKAQLKMGQAYELCQLGCEFKPSYSLHYYGLAARQGQAEGALGVSRWFLFGYEGHFGKNEPLAFKYAAEAADAKLATGEFAMGYYHEIGIHVQKDLDKARYWYEQAATHGNKDAVGRLESLNHNHTLSKQDHETTALGRIKSQHGSMRGKRPERLSRQNQQMPTLSESKPGTPSHDRSPRISPHPSPRHAEFPNATLNNGGRPPAFTVNLDNNNNLALRPKSAAPYPEDDSKPAPLNVVRPRSAAPYPDDVNGGRPAYNPQMRHSGQPAPHTDRPAFGIRPSSSGIGASHPGPGQQNLSPGIPPAGMPPRGRVPVGGPQGGYRQPSPGAPGGYRRGSQGTSPQLSPIYNKTGTPQPGRQPSGVGPGTGMGTAAGLIGDPTGNRLTKPLPNLGRGAPGSAPYPPSHGSTGSPAPYPSTQPGRDYSGSGSVGGARPAPRPTPNAYGGGPAPMQGQSLPASPHPRQSSQPQPRPGMAPPLKPTPIDAGRSSAPPGGRPAQVSSPAPSTAPSVASTSAAHGGAPSGKPARVATDHPDGKTMGGGPATFDQMGIPAEKESSECIVM